MVPLVAVLVINDGPNGSDDGLVRLAGANSYDGGTRFLGGSLEVLNDSALGSGTVLIEDRSNSNPGLLLGLDGLNLANDIVLSNRGGSKTITLNLDGSNQAELSGGITLDETGNRNNRFIVGTDDVLTLSGVVSGDGRLTLRREEGGGTLVLTNANTFTGDTRIEEGTLRIENNQALGVGTVLIEDRGVNPVLEFAGGLTVANDLSISNRGGAKRLRLDEAGTSQTTLNGAILISEAAQGRFDVQAGFNDRLILAGAISGTTSAGIDKLGSGTLVLQTASNTYTGRTRIIAGTLLINGDNSAATGDVEVNAGATVGGTGSSGGALQVAGVVAPGDASIATLAAGAAVFTDGSSFAFELDSSAAASASADMLVLNSALSVSASGNLSLSGTVELSLTDIAASPNAFALGTKLNLINYDGIWGGGVF